MWNFLTQKMNGMCLPIDGIVGAKSCILWQKVWKKIIRKFCHFHITKLLFLSIFCWYFRNFVGTNDILVGLHVPTYFQMYRQNSEKALLGGGGSSPPPPPPLATLVVGYTHGCPDLRVSGCVQTYINIQLHYYSCLYHKNDLQDNAHIQFRHFSDWNKRKTCVLL